MIESITGILGMILILLAFFLNEFWKGFNHDDTSYNLINIIGAGLLTVYSYMIISWPFFILNGVWLVVAVVKLGNILIKKD